MAAGWSASVCSVSLLSLSLPWECEQACGIESQQPIPALIAQRQACGTWQRCPMSDARYHKPQQPCLLRCGWGVPALKGDTSACATEAPCVFSFPPLADSCLSSAANFRHTFSSEQGDRPVLYVINTIVNCTLKAGLRSSCYRYTVHNREIASPALYNTIYKYQGEYLGQLWLDAGWLSWSVWQQT